MVRHGVMEAVEQQAQAVCAAMVAVSATGQSRRSDMMGNVRPRASWPDRPPGFRPVLGFAGAPGRIRTPDPQIRSLVLYPTELPVRAAGV